MKLVMTLLVRDEEDSIKANIDFHKAQGVDFFIITDNLSDDGTTEILKDYEKSGVIRYVWEKSDDYNQKKWVSRMARMAFVEYGADWIINSDTDEFWYPKSGNLKKVFQLIPGEYDLARVKRYNFVPLDNADESIPFYHRMIYREIVSKNSLGKPLSPKVAHRGKENIEIVQGNHAVKDIESCNIYNPEIDILHFPIRSYGQLANKIVKGGAAYERNISVNESIGRTWRNLYKKHKADNNSLRTYYSDQAYSEDRIRKEIRTGLISEDRRLSDFFGPNIT